MQDLANSDQHTDDPFACFTVASSWSSDLPTPPQPTGQAGEEYWEHIDTMRGNNNAASQPRNNGDLKQLDAHERYEHLHSISDDPDSFIYLESQHPQFTDEPQVIDAGQVWDAASWETGYQSSDPRALHDRDLSPEDQRAKNTMHSAQDTATERLRGLWDEASGHAARQLAQAATIELTIPCRSLRARDLQLELLAAMALGIEQGTMSANPDEQDNLLIVNVTGIHGAEANARLMSTWHTPTSALANWYHQSAAPGRKISAYTRRPLTTTPVTRTEQPAPTHNGPPPAGHTNWADYLAWHTATQWLPDLIQDNEAAGLTHIGNTANGLPRFARPDRTTYAITRNMDPLKRARALLAGKRDPARKAKKLPAAHTGPQDLGRPDPLHEALHLLSFQAGPAPKPVRQRLINGRWERI